IGHPWEWFGLVKAMLETGIRPDFIVVDGAEGGTGAAPLEFLNRVGVPLREGLMLVHNTLVGAGLRESIRIGAAGKITSAFMIARTMAMGADWCNAARAFMFALGCIQAKSCHNDNCPSGVATQNPARWRNLDVEIKAQRVHMFHQNTLKGLSQLIAAAGLRHPQEIGPEHIIRRISDCEVKSYEALFPYLSPGELLRGPSEHSLFRRFWAMSRPDSFSPPDSVAALRQTKLR
ncbi:MAG: FMN-binding glutamate synthase family protein, partial [Gammaproteobacteria bacterium HGW-Gammaproteobacteria-7]